MLRLKKAARAVVAALACVAVATCLAGCSQVSSALNLNISTNTTPTAESSVAVSKDATVTEGVLTVGVNVSNTPYGGKTSNNDTVGLDVDIAGALADQMGLQLQIVDVGGNGKAALSGGQVDVALGLTKSGSGTEDAYSTAYINDGSALYVAEANAADDPKDFNAEKEKIGVVGSTPAALEAQDVVGIQATTSYDSVDAALEALEQGECKYVACDAVVGDYYANSHSGISRVGFLSSDSVTPMYAVTLTGSAEVTQAVQRSLDAISEGGQLRVVVDKWLGEAGEGLMASAVDIKSIEPLLGTADKAGE